MRAFFCIFPASSLGHATSQTYVVSCTHMTGHGVALVTWFSARVESCQDRYSLTCAKLRFGRAGRAGYPKVLSQISKTQQAQIKAVEED